MYVEDFPGLPKTIREDLFYRVSVSHAAVYSVLSTLAEQLVPCIKLGLLSPHEMQDAVWGMNGAGRAGSGLRSRRIRALANGFASPGTCTFAPQSGDFRGALHLARVCKCGKSMGARHLLTTEARI